MSNSNSNEDKLAANTLLNLIRPAASPSGLGITFGGSGAMADDVTTRISNVNSIGANSMFESMIRGSHLTTTLDSLAEAAMSSSS